jgi:hypothetical protein
MRNALVLVVIAGIFIVETRFHHHHQHPREQEQAKHNHHPILTQKENSKPSTNKISHHHRRVIKSAPSSPRNESAESYLSKFALKGREHFDELFSIGTQHGLFDLSNVKEVSLKFYFSSSAQQCQNQVLAPSIISAKFFSLFLSQFHLHLHADCQVQLSFASNHSCRKQLQHQITVSIAADRLGSNTGTHVPQYARPTVHCEGDLYPCMSTIYSRACWLTTLFFGCLVQAVVSPSVKCECMWMSSTIMLLARPILHSRSISQSHATCNIL